MARKKVTPEEEIVNTAVEGTALGSVPAGSVLHDEAGADTGDVPAELPEGDLSAEETAEQSETLPAMEAAEAKPFGLSAEEKTASQEENDTVEKRAEEAAERRAAFRAKLEAEKAADAAAAAAGEAE